MKQEIYTFKPGEIQLVPADIFKLMHLEAGRDHEPFASIVAKELKETASFQGVQGGYRIIEKVELDNDNNRLYLGGERFHIGGQVIRRIREVEGIAVFICTAGGDVDTRIEIHKQDGDLMSAYVADTIGSVLVEEAMDRIHKKLSERLSLSGWKVTNRYSPGYCGWSVSEQQDLFRLLPENFCGVTLTESMLMVPVKSVSGIIGAGRKVKFQRYTCNSCSSVNCIYRNVKERNNIE